MCFRLRVSQSYPELMMEILLYLFSQYRCRRKSQKLHQKMLRTDLDHQPWLAFSIYSFHFMKKVIFTASSVEDTLVSSHYTLWNWLAAFCTCVRVCSIFPCIRDNSELFLWKISLLVLKTTIFKLMKNPHSFIKVTYKIVSQTLVMFSTG